MKQSLTLVLVVLALVPSPINAETWNLNADGDWGVPTNWSPTAVPNSVDAVASLVGVITADRTINLDIPVTVGSISVSGPHNYTLSGSNSLSFDVSSGNAGVTVNSGNIGVDLLVNTNVVLNDTLAVDTVLSGSELSFQGSVSGAGGITKTGSGVLVLNGPSLFAGPVDVQAGTLRGTTSSLTFNIANSGIVHFEQDFDGTYAGEITGTGGLLKTRNGTLTLSGANSYTGPTLAAGGTLIATTDSLPGRVNIGSLGTFAFDQSFDGAFGEVISGSGQFEKRGTGTVTLTGVNTFSGTTTVAAGTLAVDGSLGGAVTVESGARLSGNGTLGLSLAVLDGGILAPGASIGTLTVGTLSFGGRYEVEYRAPGAGAPLVTSGSGQSLRGRNTLLDAPLAIADQDADLLVVTGAATLLPSATVVLQPTGTDASFDEAFTRAGNTNNSLEYLILRAESGITGQFVALSDTGASLDYRSASGSAEDVWLVLTQSATPVVLTGSAPTPYVMPGTMLRPRCDLRGAPGANCVVVQGNFISYDQDPEGALPGTTFDSGAGILGIAHTFDSGLQAGLAYSYQNGDLDLSDGTGHGDLSRQGGVLWAEWNDGTIDLRGWFGFGSSSIDSHRDTALGATASADIDANDLSLSFAARRWFEATPSVLVTPVLGIDAWRVKQDGYTETGGGPEDFTAGDTTRDSLATLLGVEVKTAGNYGSRQYELTGGLGWQHEWADTATEISGIYVGDPTATVLSASSPSASRDRLALDLGATLWLDDRTALHAGYGLSIGDDLTDQSLGLRLSTSF